MTFPARRILIILGITLLVLALLAYGGYESRKFLNGPSVTIEAPSEGAKLKGPAIEVRGHAENISFISMNGRQIYVDEDGRFSETVILPSGYTVLTVDVKDRFDRVRRVTRTLVIE